MAKYDYGGGCPCGLNRVCDCGVETIREVNVAKEKVQVVDDEGKVIEEIAPPAGMDPELEIGDLFSVPKEHLEKAKEIKKAQAEEYTGGSVNYYKVRITDPTSSDNRPYTAECNDIIEALGMNFAEGNAFKAIWRRAAARNGKLKKGYTDGFYDAEKVVFFGQRMMAQERKKK